jgi:drug/metabolite transporter (DMT)-like permease
MTDQKRAYIYAIITILLWSTIASAFKLSLNYLDYFQLLFFASIFSCIALLFILIFQGKLLLLKQTTGKDILRSAFMGMLNPFLYYLVLLKAYSLLKAQEAGTLNYIWPIVLVLLSVPLLKQKIHWLSIIAILISFSGILLISTEGKIMTLGFKEPLGVLLAIGSSFFWALYWIFNLKDKRDEVAKLLMNFIFGSMYVSLALFYYSGLDNISFKGLTGALYIGLFEMGLTYVLWLKALKYASNTAIISNLVYLSPFISLIIIRNVIGEKILFATVAGLALIICGIAVQHFSRKLTR